MLVEQEVCNLACTHVASLSGLDHNIHDQPGAGPSTSQTALPTALLVSGGRHRWPHCPPIKDAIMVNHAVDFLDVTSDIHMTLDEGEKIESVKHNLKLCIVPPVPVGKCKLGSNEIIDLTLSEWKPPTWSSKKSHERREVLKGKGKATCPQVEEEQASAVGIPPPTPRPSGGYLVLQEQIADTPAALTPAPSVGSTPTSALINCVAVQPHEAQPASEQHPGPSSQAQSSMKTQPPHKVKGAKPSGGKSRGIPELPLNAPSLNSPIEVWRDFMDKEQNIGAKTATGLPTCSEGMIPVKGASHPWDGKFTTSANRAAITAYLTANGVSMYEAANMLQWAHQVG
ncbi:hypothetical protein BKA82DRAFT_4015892 [Pisolithus tinctorius]|nr:hypothetical protein BKA82DRAFT_4015892 [Pisolithus tinctorius]